MNWSSRLAAAMIWLPLAMPTARATDIVVYHNWSAPAELAALNVLRQSMEARGDRWIPLSIPHDVTEMDVLTLIKAGATPNVFLQMQPAIYRALEAEGKLLHLDGQFTESGLLDHLPDVVRTAITVDGDIVKVPATIHADATIYYNRHVAAEAGIEPENWTSLEDMWADFPAVIASGHLPIAMGAQRWQIGYLTHSLVAAIGGPKLYLSLYGEKPDRSALDDAALPKVFSWLRRFQRAADPGSLDREWNRGTNMVISGEALLQVQGDWMKGEWRAAGKTGEQDFGCLFLPGARALPVTVDSWGLLAGTTPQVEAAERAFADSVIAADIQASFAAAKGSTPVRLDALTGIDQCSLDVLTALERPGFAVPTPHLAAPPDWINTVWDTATAFWNDSTMSSQTAIATLQSRLAARAR